MTSRNLPASARSLGVPQSLSGCRIGWIAGADSRGLLVDYEGNPAGPLSAPSTVSFEREEIGAAVSSRQQVVLLFEGGEPARPIIVGLIQPTSSARLLEEVLSSPASESNPVAVVDGRRVCIEGRDEVVLRCGEASITLQRDGKVVVRGTRITSTAKGTHRIRGGSVQIN
jgi:hypothetical protein